MAVDTSAIAKLDVEAGELPETMAAWVASRGFAKRVKEILGDAPDILFEHVGRAIRV